MGSFVKRHLAPNSLPDRMFRPHPILQRESNAAPILAFATHALAPASFATSTRCLSACDDKITIADCSESDLMTRAASMPLSTGILTFRRTTSGLSFAASRHLKCPRENIDCNYPSPPMY